MQLVGSLCKRHVVTCAPTACRRTVSGTISLPYSGCFSPFPYGTGSLSIDKEYLALRDGTRRFRQDFSGPALLRILYVQQILHLRGYHPLWLHFPEYSILFVFLKTVLQPQSCTQLWFGLFPVRSPLLGESFVIFFSSGYLDVSVQRVCSPIGVTCLQHAGLSHSEIFGYIACVQLPEAYRSLPRPSSPLIV